MLFTGTGGAVALFAAVSFTTVLPGSADVNANVPAVAAPFAGVVFCETVSLPGFTSGASGSCRTTFLGSERAAAI